MKLTTLVEITRIRQEVREADVALETMHITSPEDAFLVAKRFIRVPRHSAKHEEPSHRRSPGARRKHQLEYHPPT